MSSFLFISAKGTELQSLIFYFISYYTSLFDLVQNLSKVIGNNVDYRNKMSSREEHSDQGCNTTELNILTQNLDLDLVEKVKENWVDPKKFVVQQMIGNGK